MNPDPKPKTYRSKKYLDFIRQKSCLFCGKKSEPHHVSFGGDRGTGIKPPDTQCVPLCRECHQRTHNGNIGHVYFAREIIRLMTEYIGVIE